MKPVIILLRGVNVGGHARLPMDDFASLLAACGCAGVKTYINSGNAVALSAQKPADLARDFAAACQARMGFAPGTLVLPLAELEAVIAANPFPGAEDLPKAHHAFFFLSAPGRPDEAAMRALCAPGEDFLLTPAVLYLKLPEKLTDSLLIPKVGRFIKAPLTGRNWRTVTVLAAMARALPGVSGRDISAG